MPIKFLNDVAVDTSVLYVDTVNDRVGIGTASPASKLQVNTGTDINAQIGLDSFGSFKLGDISNNYTGRGIYYDGTAGSEDLDILTNTFNIAGGSGEGIKVVSSTDVQLSSPTGVVITINGTSSNVGIGTTSPSQKFHVVGNARVTGAYYDSNNSPGTSNQVLVSTVTGTDWIDGTAIPGLVDGTGTANYVARWIGTESIGIGVIYDNGTNVGIGTTSPGEKLTLQTQATGLGSEGVFIKNPFAGSTPIVNSKSPFLSLATSNSSGYTSTIYMGRNGTATGQESKIEWSNSNDGLSIYVAGQGSYREHVRFGNLSSSVARTYFNGTVGIGTTSPGAKLDVVGSARFNNLLATNSTNGAAKAFIHVASSAGAAKFKVYKNVNTTDGYAYFRIDRAYDYGNNDQMIQEAVYQRRTTTKNVKFKYEGDVATADDVYLEFYELTDGTVEAWICHDDYAEVGVSITYFESTGDTYPTPSAGTPTGTLIHSTNPDTETPNWDSYQGDGYFAGNVGIGTTSPTNGKLVIDSTANQIAIETGTAGDGRLNIGHFSNGTFIGTYGDDGGVADIIRFGTHSGDERMRITSAGNVGIGTTSPSYKLDVNGTGRFAGDVSVEDNLYLTDAGTVRGKIQLNSSDRDDLDIKAVSLGSNMKFFTVDTERMRINSSGNVGIGTTSPSELLHIEGTLPEVLIKGTGVYDPSVITMSNGSGDSSFITNYNNPAVKGLWLKYDNGSTGDATIKVGQNELLFDVNNGAAMYINSSRNVGINATSLYSKLHIGNSSNSNNNLLTMESSGPVWVHLKTPSNTQSQIGFGESQFVNQNTRGRIVYNSSTTTANNYMSFTTNFAEVMRITNSNVGIGTTSPAAKLDIDDSSNDVSLTNTANYAINTGSAISVRHYRNVNLETPKMQWSVGGDTDLNWKKLATIVINDANYAGFGAEVEITDFSGNYGSQMAQYGDVYKGGLSIFHRAGTGVEPEEGIITIHSDMSPYIRIYKIAGSGNSSYQIQVKSPSNYRQIHVKLEQGNGNQIASITPHANNTNGSTSGGTAYTPDAYTSVNQFKSGLATMSANRGIVLYRLGIGTTSPAYQLELSQNSAAKPTSSTWTVVSDERVKTNIRPYETGLQELLQIEPKLFDYNGKAGFDATAKNNIGVIAQEIKDVMPETVKKYNAKLNEEDEEDTELYNFDSHALTFALINSVKELNAKIENLEAKIQTLKNK